MDEPAPEGNRGARVARDGVTMEPAAPSSSRRQGVAN